MQQRGWVSAMATALCAAALLAGATPATAFDAGPHSEITAGAIRDAGFGDDATGVVEINNWFVDLYARAAENPFSGYGPAEARAGVGAVRTENWPQDLVAAALRAHFDNEPTSIPDGKMPSLGTTAGIKAEWDRLQRAVWTLVREARDKDDVELLLGTLGASLHQVQDFYTHTNWVEPPGGPLGTDGPGWQERGYGSSPTWFDMPADVREQATIYADTTPGHTRAHGFWNTDDNNSLANGMNKDWEGRPLYIPAAISASFASRQWISAVRSWVDDEEFWKRAQAYSANRKDLDLDREAMYKISLYSGHWRGQGEPWGGEYRGSGGSLLELRAAAKKYFQRGSALGGLVATAVNPIATITNPVNGAVPSSQLRGRSEYRARFERIIRRMADPKPSGEVGPVPSTQDLQRSTRFVVMRVMDMKGHGLGDPGPDDADMYFNAGIDGQRMTSAVLHDHDKFNFPNPYEPPTFLKAVPVSFDRGEPVESIEVEVKTASAHWAGTDDDVYLRLSGGVRYPLDKRMYNDFESGDRDRYSVPIDDSVKAGMVVGDITRVEIEKDSDGLLGGGWKLGGVKLTVNGRVVYNNQGIDRWLQDDDRDWRAPDYQRVDPRGRRIPIWLQVREDDYVYGDDDDGDVNPYDRRDLLSIGYMPGTTTETRTKGGNLLMGRWQYGGDEVEVKYRLETITPEPMRQTGPPTPTHAPGPPVRRVTGPPDLVISALRHDSVTVTNQGGELAGAFRLSATGDEGLEEVLSFQGLAPGASVTRPILVFPCAGAYRAVVDDLGQVAESSETNNEAASVSAICRR